MKKLFLSILVASTILATSCGKTDTVANGGDSIKKPIKTDTPTKGKLSPEVIKNIIESIPSPAEISFLIKDSGVKYDQSMMNSADNVGNYSTDYKKALNLGIYSTDLGYANIYEQSQDAITLVTAVRDMADGLNIVKFFDFENIRKLAASGSENLDKLLEETTMNLQKMNDHLQEEDRTDMTVLVLTGGWIESLYLTCKVAKIKTSEELNSRIAEQKITLDQIILLVEHYEASPKMKTLREELVALDKIYASIEVKTIPGESKKVEKGGTITIEQTGTTEVKMKPGDLDAILAQVTLIRDNITKK